MYNTNTPQEEKYNTHSAISERISHTVKYIKILHKNRARSKCKIIKHKIPQYQST